MAERYHFIGIGGIGMSGLAQILLERKERVSGSDLAEGPITNRLKERGAAIYLGQSAGNICPSMTVVISSDIKEGNPELVEAKRQQCKILHRSEMLRDLMAGRRALAVTGTHGKTTTTSLLSTVLYEGETDPSFSIGGILPKFQSNARHGTGPFFVAEADESDGSFLTYNPHGAIVTNIGLDHMEHYRTEENLIGCFKRFMDKVENQDLLFWCGDDARLKRIRHAGVSYGFSEGSDLKLNNFRQEGWKCFFDLLFENKAYRGIEIGLIGQHNALNAAAVFGLALRLGVKEEKIRLALKSFSGVARRCEKKGEVNSALFLDDYGHHPTEIQTTLRAIRQALPKRRLIAVFQPHRYTRTRDCMGHWGKVFQEADHLLLTEIYSAGEAEIQGVSSSKILEEIQKEGKISCELIPRERAAAHLFALVRPMDVVVTIGAGNITKVAGETFELMK